MNSLNRTAFGGLLILFCCHGFGDGGLPHQDRSGVPGGMTAAQKRHL
jgi:hypothetical protein